MSTPTLPQRPEMVVSHFSQFKAPRASGKQPGLETKVLCDILALVGLLVGSLNPDCVISAPVCVMRGLLGHHAARCEEHSVWFAEIIQNRGNKCLLCGTSTKHSHGDITPPRMLPKVSHRNSVLYKLKRLWVCSLVLYVIHRNMRKL